MTKLVVYRQQPPGTGVSGPLDTWELGPPQAEPRPSAQAPAIVSWSVSWPTTAKPWVLDGEIWIRDTALGRVDLDEWLFPGPNLNWHWRLSPQDLQRAEQTRGGRDVQLQFRLRGLASIPNVSLGEGDLTQSSVVPVRVSGTERVAQSDWVHWLTQWDYLPTHDIAWPLQDAHWPQWETVVSTMQGAVRALSQGAGHEALAQCLSALEGFHSAPYQPKSWQNLFAVDAQKEEGLKALAAGLGTYLNKVGWHRARHDQRDGGDNPRSPVDQWEAEVGVAMTALLLAYLRRLPLRPDETTSK